MRNSPNKSVAATMAFLSALVGAGTADARKKLAFKPMEEDTTVRAGEAKWADDQPINNVRKKANGTILLAAEPGSIVDLEGECPTGYKAVPDSSAFDNPSGARIFTTEVTQNERRFRSRTTVPAGVDRGLAVISCRKDDPKSSSIFVNDLVAGFQIGQNPFSNGQKETESPPADENAGKAASPTPTSTPTSTTPKAGDPNRTRLSLEAGIGLDTTLDEWSPALDFRASGTIGLLRGEEWYKSLFLRLGYAYRRGDETVTGTDSVDRGITATRHGLEALLGFKFDLSDRFGLTLEAGAALNYLPAVPTGPDMQIPDQWELAGRLRATAPVRLFGPCGIVFTIDADIARKFGIGPGAGFYCAR